MRIVSLCPSNTEVAHYLGFADQLVGIDDYSDWPEKVTHLPRVGPDISIDMDKVEALKPDLVLASLSVPGMEKNIEELKKRQLPYVVSGPDTLADVRKDLLFFGEATDTLKRAEQLVAAFDQFIAFYKEKAKQCTPTSLYWEWWPKPVFTPGGGNWLSTVSELAGGKNIFDDYEEANVQTDWEDVKGRNPDHICLVWVGVQTNKMNPELLYKREGWKELDALQHQRIYLLEESLFCRPSPRLLKGIEKLAHLLHPDVFPFPQQGDPLLRENRIP